jgi:hypothetical protein
MDRFKAAPFASMANNLRYRASGESMVRSCDPCKHCAALRACGTAVTQVSRNCFADIRGQGQSFGAIALAVSNHDLAGSPIDVLKLQFGDFACPQAQANKHGQDREVTTATSGAGVAGRQKALHLVRGQSLRQSG